MFESLIWLVPAAVLAAGIWRPHAGLVVLVGTLPLFGSPPGGPYLGALEAAGLAAIATAWRAGRAESSVLSWPVAAFAIVALATLLPSPYLPPSWRPSTLLGVSRALPGVENWSALYTWRAAADLVLGCGLFVATRRAFAGRSLRPLGLALATGLAGTLALGFLAQPGLIDLDSYRPRYGVNLPFPRMQSVFFLSGWLSQFVVLTAPVAVAALAAGSRWQRRASLPLLVLALAGLALTLQRGAWVAAAAQLGAALWLIVDRRRAPKTDLRRIALGTLAAAVVLLLLLVASGSLSAVTERLGSVASGFGPRMPLWSAAVEMARERPLLGWGVGSFTPAYDLLHPRGTAGAAPYRGSAHSLYLHVAAERGVLGVLSLALLGWAAAAALSRPRENRERLATGLTVSLVGVAVYGLLQYTFHLRNISWQFWILLGCVALASRSTGRDQRQAVVSWARGLVVVMLVLAPIRAFLTEPPSLAGSRTFGLHELEGEGEGYRWIEGRAALRVPWRSEELVIRLANGHPRAGARPVTVTVRIDGEQVERSTVVGGWEEHRFRLGAPTADWVELALEVEPTFRPFSEYRSWPDLRRSTDIRSLGVALALPAGSDK